MKVLTKAEIAAVQNRAPVAVPVPEWGDECGIFAKRLSGFEREQLLKSIKATDSDYTTASLAVAAAACDESGEFLFLNREEAEKTILDPDVMQRLGREVFRVNRMLKESLDDAQKKSETIQSAPSGSN